MRTFRFGPIRVSPLPRINRLLKKLGVLPKGFLFLCMRSPSDDDLARSISELKDVFRSGLSSLKRELAQEHDAALKKLKTATASVPKF